MRIIFLEISLNFSTRGNINQLKKKKKQIKITAKCLLVKFNF